MASRRRAEELISAGRVSVNGITAQLGMSADAQTDEITLDGVSVRSGGERTYIMLNKPRGYVTTLSDEKGRRTVSELVEDAGGRLYPVGRLDMYSEGLLIMTDDGEVANALMHPSHEVRKTYIASVTGGGIEAAAELLRAPMYIDGYKTHGARVRVLEADRDTAQLEIIISEGRNRQVRKMCDAAGLKVTRLRRIAEGELRLGALKCGAWRRLTEKEKQYLRELV